MGILCAERKTRGLVIAANSVKSVIGSTEGTSRNANELVLVRWQMEIRSNAATAVKVPSAIKSLNAAKSARRFDIAARNAKRFIGKEVINGYAVLAE